MDTFIPEILNQASRNKDESKVLTLGAFAFILQQILYFAPSKRTDIDTFKFESFVFLYRSASLTNTQIQEYEALIDKKDKHGYGRTIAFKGFISCTLDPKVAERYTQHMKKDKLKNVVMYRINWEKPCDYYLLNFGCFENDQEVLLTDGMQLLVQSVQKIKGSDGESKMLITLKNA